MQDPNADLIGEKKANCNRKNIEICWSLQPWTILLKLAALCCPIRASRQTLDANKISRREGVVIYVHLFTCVWKQFPLWFTIDKMYVHNRIYSHKKTWVLTLFKSRSLLLRLTASAPMLVHGQPFIWFPANTSNV